MAVLCISLSRYANRAYHPRCTFLSCCSLSSDGLLLLFTLQPAGGSRLLQKRRSGGLSWWRMNGNEVEAEAGRSFCSVCCTRVCPNLCTRISVVDIYSSVNADVEHLSSRALNVRNITIFLFYSFKIPLSSLAFHDGPLIHSSLFCAIMGHLGWQSHTYSIIQNPNDLQYHYVVKVYLMTVSQGVGNCEQCSWLRRGPVMKKWSVIRIFSPCIIHGITSTRACLPMHTCPVLAEIAKKSTALHSTAYTLE